MVLVGNSKLLRAYLITYVSFLGITDVSVGIENSHPQKIFSLAFFCGYRLSLSSLANSSLQACEYHIFFDIAFPFLQYLGGTSHPALHDSHQNFLEKNQESRKCTFKLMLQPKICNFFTRLATNCLYFSSLLLPRNFFTISLKLNPTFFS